MNRLHRMCCAVCPGLLVTGALLIAPDTQAAQGQIYKPAKVKFQEEAASIQVTVIGRARWDDVATHLQPDFDMTEKAALEGSIPVTLSYYQEAISAFKAALKVALPGTSTAVTDTTQVTNQATNSVTETISRRIPGSLDQATPTAATIPSASTASGSVPGGALSTETLTRYQNAKTLFQEIRILNRMLKDAPTRDGYEPYLVNLQISLIPYQRNLPYDAYSTISFFSGLFADSESLGPRTSEWEQSCGAKRPSPAPPVVIPLLATDTLEAADNDRLLNQIRQLNFALAGMIKGVGLSAAVDYFNQNLEGINGRDLNGLLTLGRLTQNTLHARLGAMHQSRSEYAMVPRTHHVAMLLLVPKSETHVRLVARTTLRHALSGETLESRSQCQIVKRVRALLEAKDPDDDFDALNPDDLFRPILQNNYPGFVTAIKQLKHDKLTNHTDALWLELAGLWSGSQYGRDVLELPGKPKLILPEDSSQTAIFSDDTKTAMTCVLRGGSNLVASAITASLKLIHNRICRNISASAIEVLDDGRSLKLTFPSLYVLQRAPDPVAMPPEMIEKSINQLSLQHACSNSSFKDVLYIQTQKPEPKKEELPVALNKITGFLIAGQTNTLGLTLEIKKPAAGPNFWLDIKGPYVTAIKDHKTKVLGEMTLGYYPILASGDVSLEFGPMPSGSGVQFILRNPEKKELGPLTDEIKATPK